MTQSQHFIPLDDIHDDLIFLKDGSASLIIVTSAVNFGLLFETEQMAIIESFAGLLNSLSFPIQIVVHSKRLDVSSYLGVLDRAAANQTNPLLKTMTVYYRQFVEGLIKEKNVLDKQFYVCVHVSPLELGLSKKNSPDRVKKAATVLMPRRDHLLRQLSRLGLKSRQLNTVELVKLFYELYNPPLGGKIPVATAPAAPIPVKAAPQPLKFTAPLNTQIRMTHDTQNREQKTETSVNPVSAPPTNLAQLAQNPAPLVTANTNTAFIVEELPDE